MKRGHEKGFFLGVTKMFWKRLWQGWKNSEYTQICWIVHFKWANYTCELYFNKAVIKAKKRKKAENFLFQAGKVLWGWISRPSGLLWFRSGIFLFQQLWVPSSRRLFSRLVLRSSLPSTSTLSPGQATLSVALDLVCSAPLPSLPLHCAHTAQLPPALKCQSCHLEPWRRRGPQCCDVFGWRVSLGPALPGSEGD